MKHDVTWKQSIIACLLIALPIGGYFFGRWKLASEYEQAFNQFSEGLGEMFEKHGDEIPEEIERAERR